MKSLCFILISIIIIPAVWFSSCAKVDDYDTDEKPTVSSVKFNSDDTVMYKNNDTIKINVSKNPDSTYIDTLVIGKSLYLTARFQDSIGLSSYRVKMFVDIEGKKPHEIWALGEDIFSSKKDRITDTLIARNTLFLIPEYVMKDSDTLRLKEGIYDIQIAYGNIANNRDSTYYKVAILSRDSLYKIRFRKDPPL